jgi:GNAT superfamily N-acetyltransferase
MEPRDMPRATALTAQLGYPASVDEVAARFARVSRSERDALLVAERSAHGIDGWVHLHEARTLESDPHVEVWGLVVDEHARRLGVGRALMEEAERWARRRGLTTLRLRSNVIRRDAHAFYERLGYRIVKTQHAFEKRL